MRRAPSCKTFSPINGLFHSNFYGNEMEPATHKFSENFVLPTTSQLSENEIVPTISKCYGHVAMIQSLQHSMELRWDKRLHIFVDITWISSSSISCGIQVEQETIHFLEIMWTRLFPNDGIEVKSKFSLFRKSGPSDYFEKKNLISGKTTSIFLHL